MTTVKRPAWLGLCLSHGSKEPVINRACRPRSQSQPQPPNRLPPPMCAQPTLVSIPPEVLDEIAFHTVTSHRAGPPHDFYNLLITSKAITISLALHARVFRSQFDYAALQRRFSATWLTSNVLAEQLKSRWLSLKRIRKAAEAYERQQAMREVWKLDMTNVAEDLWTAFFMLLESDGKNVRHRKSGRDSPGAPPG